MTHQSFTVASRDLSTTLDQLNYISQLLCELTKMVPAQAGPRLPERLQDAHLELTHTAARLLSEHVSELDASLKRSKSGVRKRTVRRP